MKRGFGLLCFFLFLLAGCSNKPSPIEFGKDQCAFCRMTIADPRFGAELITDKGRIYKYDAIECMVNHLHEDAPAYQQLLVIGYDIPGKLQPIDAVTFVVSPAYNSPMGANLAAFANTDAIAKEDTTTILAWEEVMAELKESKVKYKE